jgi:hypothetical protein
MPIGAVWPQPFPPWQLAESQTESAIVRWQRSRTMPSGPISLGSVFLTQLTLRLLPFTYNGQTAFPAFRSVPPFGGSGLNACFQWLTSVIARNADFPSERSDMPVWPAPTCVWLEHDARLSFVAPATPQALI